MTSTTARPASASAAPAWLEALAFALLALLPLGMAIANKSAPPMMVAAALAALASRWSAGETAVVRDRLRSLLLTPIGAGCLAFLVFAAVSIAWSHHPKRSISTYGELLLVAGSALVLHASLPRRIPGWSVKLAVIAIALGCLSITAELASGMALRTQLGVRDYTFIFKRSVAAILMVTWPLVALLWLQRKVSLAVALMLLFAIACYAAQSSATLVALVAGLAAGACAMWSSRLAAFGVAGALVAAMMIAPVLGDVAVRLLPQPMVERLRFAHADQRIEVWQSFGEVVRRRPALGAGFGTSAVMAQEPVAAEVPERHRQMLGAWHPHNGYLQVWAETGLVGAMLFGIPLVLAVVALARTRGAQAAAAAGLVASAAFIMLVGHGLWQGWWSAMIGAALIWLARLRDPVEPAVRADPTVRTATGRAPIRP